MKKLRIWLLLLLAVLLPLQGGVQAAAMACSQMTGAPDVALVAASDEHSATDLAVEHLPASAQDSAHHGTGEHQRTDATTPDCGLDVTHCSHVALPHGLVRLAASPLSFEPPPAYACASPDFLVGGQDRPPRAA